LALERGDAGLCNAPMISITLNQQSLPASTRAQLDASLAVVRAREKFELWISTEAGPMMCMLRNGESAWLMYLNEPGDSGFSSRGEVARAGATTYTLANGQVDEYPLSWCVSLPSCLQAIEEFWVSAGCLPSRISWSRD